MEYVSNKYRVRYLIYCIKILYCSHILFLLISCRDRVFHFFRLASQNDAKVTVLKP